MSNELSVETVRAFIGSGPCQATRMKWIAQNCLLFREENISTVLADYIYTHIIAPTIDEPDAIGFEDGEIYISDALAWFAPTWFVQNRFLQINNDQSVILLSNTVCKLTDYFDTVCIAGFSEARNGNDVHVTMHHAIHMEDGQNEVKTAFVEVARILKQINEEWPVIRCKPIELGASLDLTFFEEVIITMINDLYGWINGELGTPRWVDKAQMRNAS